MTDPKPDDLAKLRARLRRGVVRGDVYLDPATVREAEEALERLTKELASAKAATRIALAELDRLTPMREGIAAAERARDEAVAELQKLRGEQDTGAQPIPPPAVDRVARLVFQREYDNSAEAFDRLAAEVDAGMQHSGDCTKESHTCHVCQIAEVRKASREYIAASSAHPPEVVRLIEAARHLVNMFCGDGDPAWQGEAIQEVIDALTPFRSETGS